MTNPVPTIAPTTDQIAQVAEGIDGVSAEQLAMALDQLNKLNNWEPQGTVKFNAETKEVAHRAAEGGVPFWHISPEEGAQYRLADPTLPGTWTQISVE